MLSEKAKHKRLLHDYIYVKHSEQATLQRESFRAVAAWRGQQTGHNMWRDSYVPAYWVFFSFGVVNFFYTWG